MLQHGAYNLLIDACYDREVFPTLRDALEWAWASNQDEEDAVKFVLNRFFSCEDGVYVQKHINEDLQEYRGLCEANRIIALKREENKRNGKSTKRAKKSTKRAGSVNDHKRNVAKTAPNQQPTTNNQEPLTNNQSLEICNKENILDEKELMEKYMDDALLAFAAWHDISGSDIVRCSEPDGVAAMRLFETGVTYEDLIAVIFPACENAMAVGAEPPSLQSICTNYPQ